MNKTTTIPTSAPAPLNERPSFRVLNWTVGLMLLVWLLAALAVSLQGGLELDGTSPPLPLLLFLLVPIGCYVAALRTSARFRSWIDALPADLLVLVHGWRMVGLGFVFLFFFQLLPPVFALVAGLGDAIAAVGAIFLGWRLARGSGVTRAQLLVWNSFGLLDFLAAVSLGLASRGALFGSEITTSPMGQFPLSLIPTFVVPLLVITHLIIFRRARSLTVA